MTEKRQNNLLTQEINKRKTKKGKKIKKTVAFNALKKYTLFNHELSLCNSLRKFKKVYMKPANRIWLICHIYISINDSSHGMLLNL